VLVFVCWSHGLRWQGIAMLNIHPGSRVGGDMAPAVAAIVAAIDAAHAAVPRVCVVLEVRAPPGWIHEFLNQTRAEHGRPGHRDR
jgi:hypothetical protein